LGAAAAAKVRDCFSIRVGYGFYSWLVFAGNVGFIIVIVGNVRSDLQLKKLMVKGEFTYLGYTTVGTGWRWVLCSSRFELLTVGCYKLH